MSVQDTINKAVDYAVKIANDDSHGYSQYNRWGNPDYDCSSLVISAWDFAGVPVIKNGATYTGNMRKAFLNSGFIEVPLSDRRRGDVLLNEKHHTAMMVDSYSIVQASISENGTITGKGGDQTGFEIATRAYYQYSKGWDCVLRYVGNGETPTKEPVDIQITVKEVRKGVKHPAVRTMQILLNAKANEHLEVDGSFGSLSESAVKRYQKSVGIGQDGICGKKTWTSLINK